MEKKNELPEGWAYAFLPDIVKNEKFAIKRGPFGSHLKKEFFVESGYKVYEQQHAINNDFTLGSYYIDEKKFQELKNFEIKKNDLIISCSGTIGKIAVVPDNFEKGIINQALLKISLNSDIISKTYFSNLFKFWMMQAQIESHGSSMGNLSSVTVLKKIPILLPPINEQKRIVEKIEELFSNLSNIRKNLEQTKLQLKQYKQSILNYAFEGKLSKQWRVDNHVKTIDEDLEQIDHDCKNSNCKIKTKILLDVPNNWKCISIGRAVIFLGSGITPKGGKSVYQNSGIPFIRSQNVYPEGLRVDNVAYVSKKLHDIMSRTHIHEGDILLNITGASIGRSCIIPINFGNANVNQHVCIIRAHSKINSQFLSYWLNSPKFQELISSIQQGETRQALNFEQIRGMPFPLCSFLEQGEIVKKLDENMLLIANSENTLNFLIQQLDKQLSTILKRAFEGKLIPQDPNDEPASELLKRIKNQ